MCVYVCMCMWCVDSREAEENRQRLMNQVGRLVGR